MEVVEVALLLQIAEDGFRVFIGPVGKHDDVIAIEFDQMFVLWIDDECTIVTGLLLKAAMAVVPVGAALRERDPVSKRLAGGDAWKTKTGNAVHISGRPDSVPMNRGRHLQSIGDRYGYRVALAPSEERARNRTVDSGRDTAPASEIDGRLLDDKIEMATGQHRRFGDTLHRQRWPTP